MVELKAVIFRHQNKRESVTNVLDGYTALTPEVGGG
jgi:hypothetical protein